MRNLLVSSFFASSAALAFIACGGTDPVTNPVGNGDAGADVIVKPPTDGGKDTGTGPTVDIKGSTALAISVVSGPGGGPLKLGDKGTGVDGAGVRVENADGSGFIDGVTDATGKVSISVDLAKGPFNVTAAKVGFGIASVMGVKAAADLSKNIWLPQPLVVKNYNISGAVSGLKAAATNKVQIDSGWFATVFSAANPKNYTAQHVWVDADKIPVQLAGIEIDANNNAVQGEMMAPVARTQGVMTADLTFDNKALTPTTSNISITLASSGQFTGTMAKYVGDLTSAKVAWSNTTVAKSVGLSAAYVGIATLGLPASNVSNLKVQYFTDPSMKPDYASCFFTDQMGNGLSYNVTNLADGGKFNVPAIAKLDVGAKASAMDDTVLTADATGATTLTASLSDSKTNDTIWAIYFTGLTVTNAALPHLPASVAFSDVSGAANAFVDIAASHAATAPSDYSFGAGGTLSDWSYSNGAQIATTGR